jgi:outer membrane lipoprotein carrier protein
MRIVALCGLLLAAVLTSAQEKEITAKDVAEFVQQRYQAMDDVVAKFTQHVTFNFSKIEQTFAGTLTMKKPNKYRVESEHQTIVTNGTVVWSYSPFNKQVLVDRYKENQNTLSPEKFLLSLPAQYYTTLLGKGKIASMETVVLKLVPKDDQSFIKSVKMWVQEKTWLVRKVLVLDVNDTETEYTINDLRINTHVNESFFSFTPPAGTEVVDLR